MKVLEASKGLSLVCKYLKENSIAFKDEYKKFNSNYFKVIKDACKKYENTRDQKQLTNNYNYNNDYVACYYKVIYHNIDITKNADSILNTFSCFKDYDNIMGNIARSVLEYSSDKFINYISRHSVSLDDIEQFLNIINGAKMEDGIDIRLLYSSSELIDQFYDLAIKCKEYFGYGNFKTFINKLEQMYTFENEKFDALMNSINKSY